MKRTTSALALMAASIFGLTACGGGSDPLASDSPAASASATGGSGEAIVVGGAGVATVVLLAAVCRPFRASVRAVGVSIP